MKTMTNRQINALIKKGGRVTEVIREGGVVKYNLVTPKGKTRTRALRSTVKKET